MRLLGRRLAQQQFAEQEPSGGPARPGELVELLRARHPAQRGGDRLLSAGGENLGRVDLVARVASAAHGQALAPGNRDHRAGGGFAELSIHGRARGADQFSVRTSGVDGGWYRAMRSRSPKQRVEAFTRRVHQPPAASKNLIAEPHQVHMRYRATADAKQMIDAGSLIACSRPCGQTQQSCRWRSADSGLAMKEERAVQIGVLPREVDDDLGVRSCRRGDCQT